MRLRSRTACLLPLAFLALSTFCGAQGTPVAQGTPAGPVPPLVGAKAADGTLPTLPPGTGVALPAVSTVGSSVTVDALLLPASVANRIFGREIAQHYAVVQLTLSNHNPNASLILHSVLLDYSHWLFSNNFQPASDGAVPVTSFQQQNLPSQVGSTEARLVRGDLQDAQYWTARNTFIRLASLAGTVASAYSFLGSANFVTGTGVYGNQVVPALATFWPDRTIQQVDRISDFGFRTNHVIAKSSSDIVVAFFPIDRFLTPTLKQLYLKSPAIFFVPGEMLLDKKYSKTLGQMVLSTHVLDGVPQDTSKPTSCPTAAVTTPQGATSAIAVAFGRYERTRAGEPVTILCPRDLVLLSILKKVSLNNIRVVVGGVMTVDINAVPAVLDTITFDKSTTWAKGSTLKAALHGSFLSSAAPTLTAASAGTDISSSFDKIAVDATTSTDTVLQFTVPILKDLPTNGTLQLSLTKTAEDGSTSTSKPLAVVLAAQPPALSAVTPATAGPWAANSTLKGTLTGALLGSGVPAASTGVQNAFGACSVDTTATSSDTSLAFTCPVTTAITPATQPVSFTVSRKQADGTTVTSAPFLYKPSAP